MTNPMQNRPVEVDTHNMVNGYFNTSINKHDMNYDSSHGGIDSAVYFHSGSHRGDEVEEDANVAYQGDVANSHPITATPTGGDVTIQMEPDQPYATRRDVMDSDDNNEDDDDECEEEDDCEDAVGSDFLGALVDSSLPLAERERAAAKEIRHKITGGSTTTNVGTTGAGATGVEEFYRHCSNLSAVHCMRLLHTTTSGLSSSASTYRSEVFGPNCLDSSNRATWYKQLIGCFMHPFNILLLILAIIAGATNDYGSVGLLLGMIGISVLISFVQERKASISAEALKSRITQHAVVRRAREPTGQVLPIDATHSSSANPRAPALIGSTVEMANVKVIKSPEFTSVRSESETSSANGVPSASGASHSNSNTLDSNTSANLFGLSSSSGAFSVESVPASKLVPGDLVLLSAGSLLPADLRIIACSGLLINQTVLTGESLPVEKGSQAYRMKQSASLDESNPSSEDHWLRRSNLAFMGSSVDSGSGVGVVLATGGLTYFGRNAKDLQASRPPSDFSKGVKQVSYVLMTFTLIMLPLVIIINGITSSDWVEAALFGAAVAVGITPAMLPMIVNGNLSLAAHRLSKRKCLVKRLESIQNLGAINILAVDKTGTLTNDHVSLQGHLSVDGASCDRVLDTAYMIAKLQQGFRNVLDHAIIRAYEERYTDGTKPSGFGAFVKELPFDFQRRRMSVIVDSNPDRMLYCKGALAEMIRVCTHYIDPESQLVCPLDQNMLTQLHELGQTLASQGMRVLGVGKKVANDGPVSASQGWTTLDEAKLTLVGVLTFLDEPKESAGPALDLLRSLSVHVKVLTGDNPLVAKQVCSQLGMKDVQMLTGDDMTRLTSDDDDPVLQQLFYDTVIFSQLAPHDKARVVRCLRFRGDVVGMLGDGVNDALALREADVGISVDTGTELAKDAADIILTEKDLVVLADAVQTGRLTYANSIKYIKMASSGNFGNVFSLLFAAAWLPFLPIHSLQLLTQNLLYDISQIAIPFDSMDESYLRTPKRWSGGNLASFMICIGPVSSVFDIATFMIAFYYYGYDDKDDVRAVSSFQTMWFMQGLMTQTLIVHMIRTEKIPFIQSRPPIQLLLTTLVVTAIGFIIPYIPPVADMLDMVSPPGSYFGFLAALMMGYSVLLYFVKRLYMAKFKEWL